MTGWIIFGAIIVLLLWMDLRGATHNTPHSSKRALFIVALNLVLASFFAFYIGHTQSSTDAFIFATAYLVELSLSMDNVFVFVLIFQFFHIPQQLQHRALFWGVLSALFLRGIIIGGGVFLMTHLHWMTYVFGAILLWGAWRIFQHDAHHMDSMNEKLVNFIKKFCRVEDKLHGEKFLVLKKGKKYATPLLLALCVIEVTDVLFAFDSVPAVLSLTQDTFIVYTSNIFAILCLRSLYMIFADWVQKFAYLHYSLAFILFFIAIKLLGEHFFTIPISWSLGLIFTSLALGILSSFLLKNPND